MLCVYCIYTRNFCNIKVMVIGDIINYIHNNIYNIHYTHTYMYIPKYTYIWNKIITKSVFQ